MKHAYLHPRRSLIERESRLCYLNVPKAVETVKDFAVEWGKYGLEQSIDAKDAIYIQFKQLWDRETNMDLREQELQNAATFFELASPGMVQLLREGFSRETVNSLQDVADLFDHAKWVEAFATPDIFDDAVVLLQAPDMKAGPMGLIRSLPGAERKKLFAGYVDAFIPQEVRQKHDGTFGPNDAPPADREQTLADSKDTILESMNGMLGVADIADPASEQIARDVLDDRYAASGQVLTINGVDIPVKTNIDADMRKASRNIPSLVGIRDVQNMPGGSLLKGAAKLGIIGDPDIERYLEAGRIREREKSATIDRSSKEYRELSKLTTRQLSREAKTMKDVWTDMGGFEKLALIVAGVFALRSKAGQNIALLGAGYYFLAKFFGKMEKPFEPLEKLTGSTTKRFFDLPGIKDGRDKAGLYSPMDEQEAIAQGKIAADFLADDVREDVDASVTGFRLLYDMPMNELAQYVDIGDVTASGHKGILRTWDPTFRAKAKKLLAARGLDRRATDKFFDDLAGVKLPLPDAAKSAYGKDDVSVNAVETGDALVTVFYLQAANDPAKAADVKFVEAARSRVGSYDDILDENVTFNGRTANARTLMFDIARAGKQAASSETLGSFMSRRMGLVNPSPKQKEAVDESRFIEKREKLKERTHLGKDTKMTANVREPVVEVGQEDGLSLRAPITVTKEDFLKKTPQELSKMWIDALLPKLTEDIRKEFIAKYPNFDMRVSPTDPETIVYAGSDVTIPGLADLAETSVYKLAAAQPKRVFELYEAYATAIAGGVVPASKDPLE